MSFRAEYYRLANPTPVFKYATHKLWPYSTRLYNVVRSFSATLLSANLFSAQKDRLKRLSKLAARCS
jgi:hypothetical protein